jgi:hypothetical protein
MTPSHPVQAASYGGNAPELDPIALPPSLHRVVGLYCVLSADGAGNAQHPAHVLVTPPQPARQTSSQRGPPSLKRPRDVHETDYDPHSSTPYVLTGPDSLYSPSAVWRQYETNEGSSSSVFAPICFAPAAQAYSTPVRQRTPSPTLSSSQWF